MCHAWLADIPLLSYESIVLYIIRAKCLLEVKILEGEVGLNNTRGLHSGPEDILLSGDVIRDRYPVEIIQVAGDKSKTRKHVILIEAVVLGFFNSRRLKVSIHSLVALT